MIENTRLEFNCRFPLSSQALLSALVSIKSGLIIGVLVYGGMENQSSLNSFITGRLVQSGVVDKSRDYAALLAFLFATVTVFILAWEVFQRVRLSNPKGFVQLRDAMYLANIPAIFALGRALYPGALETNYIILAAAAEVSVILCFTAQNMRFAKSGSDDDAFSPLGWMLAILLFALIAGFNSPAGWTAWAILHFEDTIPLHVLRRISKYGGEIALVGAALGCFFLFATLTAKRLQVGLKLLFLAVQAILLTSLVRFLGPLHYIDGQLKVVAMLTTFGRLLFIAVGAISLAHLVWNALAVLNIGKYRIFGSIITPASAALLAVFLKISFDLPTSALEDDYHTGEFVLTYWAWQSHNMLPLADLIPARGLIFLMNGFVAEELLGGTYAVYPYTEVYIAFFALIIMFIALRPAIGTWPALFMVCFAPAIQSLGSVQIGMTSALAVVCAAMFWIGPSAWLLLWTALGTGMVLIAPGQGGLFVLATAPLGLLSLFRAWRDERHRLIFAGSLVLVSCVALALSPFGRIIFAAVQYAYEQSQVNTVAHGIAWYFGSAGSKASNPVMFEAIRGAWLFVTVGVAATTYVFARIAIPDIEKKRWLVAGIPIVLLGFLFVFRAAVRIDGGSITRLGISSTWFVCVLLPFFIYFGLKKRVPAIVVLCLALAASSLRFDNPGLNAFKHVSQQPASAFIDGDAFGVPSLGYASIKPEKAENYRVLKRFADINLSPGEPFLNLTNRNSLHYLLDRPPVLAAAPYNLVAQPQQDRALKKLAAQPPAWALADSMTIRHDGGVLGLRDNSLFRYVLENYRPVEDAGAVWMRYEAANNVARTALSEQEWSLLDRAFRPSDLKRIPALWGAVWGTLADQTIGHVALDMERVELDQILPDGTGGLVNDGDIPQLILLLSDNVNGADLGMLVFDFACEGSDRVPLKVHWKSKDYPDMRKTSARFLAQSGRMVVPLDAFPRWVLGGHMESVGISIQDRDACRNWRVSNVFLTQRKTTSDMKER